MVAAELVQPVNKTLYIIAFILESAGLSPLLLATLGFLRTIGQNSTGNRGQSALVFRLLSIIGMAGLALSIYGGSNASSTDPNKLKNSNTFRHIGTILFAVLYVLLALLHVGHWFHFRSLMKNRRTLLIAISCALPFLGIRMIYSVLSSFSGSLIATSSEPNTNSLAKFNIASGDWRIYLVMGVIMECIVTVIYTIAGAKIPLQRDYHMNAAGNPDEEHHLYGGQTGYLPPTEQAYYPQNAYAPAIAPYASQTAYDPESSAPYHKEERIAYTPPPAQAYASK